MKTETITAKHIPALDALAATVRDRIDIAENVLSQFVVTSPRLVFNSESVRHLPDSKIILTEWNVSGGLFSDGIVDRMRFLDGLGKHWLLPDGDSWEIPFKNGATLAVKSSHAGKETESKNRVCFTNAEEVIILEDVARFEVHSRHVTFVKVLDKTVTEMNVYNNGTARLKNRPLAYSPNLMEKW